MNVVDFIMSACVDHEYRKTHMGAKYTPNKKYRMLTSFHLKTLTKKDIDFLWLDATIIYHDDDDKIFFPSFLLLYMKPDEKIYAGLPNNNLSNCRMKVKDVTCKMKVKDAIKYKKKNQKNSNYDVVERFYVPMINKFEMWLST